MRASGDAESLIARLEALERRLDRLQSEADIRAALNLYARAIDRIDAPALTSIVHDDAEIHYGPDVFEGNGKAFIPAVLSIARSMRRTHHMMGASTIKITGNAAACETYTQATHIIERDGEVFEFTSGGRYLDRFERRADGVWRIAFRQVVVDWLREVDAGEALFSRIAGPPRGAHGADDPLAHFLTMHASP